MEYTIYDSTNGLITGNIQTNDANQVAHLNYIEGTHDGSIYYVVDGVLTERPLLSSIITVSDTSFKADGTDEISITNLPDCVIAINNLDEPDYPIFNEEITDGEIIFNTTMEGLYNIQIDCFPYQQYITEVEAI